MSYLSSIAVYDTPFGKLGGLLCWENFMPLARTALYAQGEQIHVAPTWDSSEGWLVTMRHIAKEGGMFAVNRSSNPMVELVEDAPEDTPEIKGDPSL